MVNVIGIAVPSEAAPLMQRMVCKLPAANSQKPLSGIILPKIDAQKNYALS